GVVDEITRFGRIIRSVAAASVSTFLPTPEGRTRRTAEPMSASTRWCNANSRSNTSCSSANEPTSARPKLFPLSSEPSTRWVVKWLPTHRGRMALAKEKHLDLRPFGGVVGRRIPVSNALPDRVAIIRAGHVTQHPVAVQDRFFSHYHDGWVVERHAAETAP